MFKGFKLYKKKVNKISINFRIGGTGDPILLLHGYPQTHIMWRKIAPTLAKKYTVICSDLRGYGDSAKPKSDKKHLTYSKYNMALDQTELMKVLGFKNYYVIGHDRGARVSHRMAIENKDIIKLIILDIVPTNVVFEKTEEKLARSYYHWFFLSQKYPLPEKLIEGASAFFLKTKLQMWGKTNNFIETAAMKEYLRCFANKKTIHASCEDYRAGATIDLEHHNKDKNKKIQCPTLVLWGKKGTVGKLYNPVEEWKKWARKVSGHSINCGHFIPEEKPKELIKAIDKFF
tara:strand:- start:44 stop:907 length:864 start_codon:yes stop_codon:yes gene_type:complete